MSRFSATETSASQMSGLAVSPSPIERVADGIIRRWDFKDVSAFEISGRWRSPFFELLPLDEVLVLAEEELFQDR